MARSISLTVRWFAMSRPNDPLGLADWARSCRGSGPWTCIFWYAQPDRLTDPALLSQYDQLLCPEEQARHARYRIERVRHEFLVTRALVRTVLSRYTAMDPVEWRFTTNAYGKPDASSPPLAEPLRFNLSHTRGTDRLAVTRLEEVRRRCGKHRPPRPPGRICAARFFASRKLRICCSYHPKSQQVVFFDYWTLKEAYIKARGKGLAIPLDQFSFDLASKDSVRICFSPELGDDSTTWRFAQFSPTSEHRAALAVDANRRACDHVVRDAAAGGTLVGLASRILARRDSAISFWTALSRNRPRLNQMSPT